MMIRAHLLGVLVIVGASVVVAQSEIPVDQQHHPPVQEVPPGPDEGPMPPPADPEDVESIDNIITAFYQSISGAKGEPRDWNRLRSLFKQQARLIAARPSNDGGMGLWALPVKDFIDANKTYFERGGYYEKEVARRVELFGNMAHAWSTYESRKVKGSHIPWTRGIYSIQLLKDGDRWWIVNMYWDTEKPGSPIPEEYLGDG